MLDRRSLGRGAAGEPVPLLPWVVTTDSTVQALRLLLTLLLRIYLWTTAVWIGALAARYR